MDCSPPGSSVHGILQARILEWVAIPFSRGSSQGSHPGIEAGAPTLQEDSLLSDPPGEPRAPDVKLARSCLTLCNPMDYTVHGILQARIPEWLAIPFSRGFFPTQGSNQGILHCRWILYQLSYEGSRVSGHQIFLHKILPFQVLGRCPQDGFLFHIKSLPSTS